MDGCFRKREFSFYPVYLSIDFSPMKALYTLLVILTTGIGVACAQSTAYPNDRSVLDSTIQPFYHGVASGDPLTDRVIIWTRVTTDSVSVPVKWRVATDTAMKNLVAQGTATADTSRDYTVKVDVTGLQPNTYYYYEFEALGRLSQRGRTKTMPVGNVSSLRLALVSCSNYSFGFFNAYDAIKNRNDLDYILHVGDYIYEDGYKTDGVDTLRRRTFPEYDAYDLTSYRLRYAWYRIDPSTRNLHQQFPFVVLWDDHEFANDCFADTADNHNPVTQGTWAKRKANAIRVFKEWIPMREDTSRTNVINFTQTAGNLADIIYTEDRIERSQFNNFDQGVNMSLATDPLAYDTPNRTMHGFRQMEWMSEQLKKSTAKWKILANQVVFASYFYKLPILGGLPAHQISGWDANPLDRKKIIDTVNAYDIKNMVVLSGDIHVAMAFDIPGGVTPYNPSTGAGSVGVEFVCDAISEGDVLPNAESFMYSNNSHLRYIKLKSQGYCIVDVTPNSVCCDYWEMDSVRSSNTRQTLLKTLCTIQNENHLKEYQGPTFTPRTFPPLIPYNPRNNGVSVGVKNNQKVVEVMSLYPNPASDYVRFQYFMKNMDNLKVDIYDMLGRLVQTDDFGIRTKGLNEDVVYVRNLSAGEYTILFRTATESSARKIIKY